MGGKGRQPAPSCPKGCRTKSGKPQHMRRLYVHPYQGKRKFEKVGWICPRCKIVLLEQNQSNKL